MMMAAESGAGGGKKQKLSSTIASAAVLEAVIREAVASTDVIDVHTHLFPPSHEPLMLWGIDELLTYHYLVGEFFMTPPAALKPDAFFALANGRVVVHVKCVSSQCQCKINIETQVIAVLNLLGR